MKLDLILLALMIFAMVRGARRGASRQLGELGAALSALYFAKPLARELEPRLAELWTRLELSDGQMPLGSGGVMVLSAIVIFLSVRAVLTGLFRHILSDARDPEGGGRDRFLGGILGGLKLAALAYVVLSFAMHWDGGRSPVRGGKGAELLPSDSRAVQLARRHNLFDGQTGRRLAKELSRPSVGSLRAPFQILPQIL